MLGDVWAYDIDLAAWSEVTTKEADASGEPPLVLGGLGETNEFITAVGCHCAAEENK